MIYRFAVIVSLLLCSGCGGGGPTKPAEQFGYTIKVFNGENSVLTKHVNSQPKIRSRSNGSDIEIRVDDETIIETNCHYVIYVDDLISK